jgi:hypothetical protein
VIEVIHESIFPHIAYNLHDCLYVADSMVSCPPSADAGLATARPMRSVRVFS